MASKTLLVCLAVMMVVALATAMAFEDDFEDDGFDVAMEALSKRADVDMEFDDDLDFEMEKRGRGKGRYYRCIHPVSGLRCACDKKYRRKNPKHYSVCAGQPQNL